MEITTVQYTLYTATCLVNHGDPHRPYGASILLQLEGVGSMFELLGILGTFKMAEHSYLSSPHSKPWLLLSF